MKKPFIVGYHKARNGKWSVNFSIGYQLFSLDKEYIEDRYYAQWYAKRLKRALRSLATKKEASK